MYGPGAAAKDAKAHRLPIFPHNQTQLELSLICFIASASRSPPGQAPKKLDVWSRGAFFLIFSIIFGVFGVYIIPNWLIKVPGHFGILFR